MKATALTTHGDLDKLQFLLSLHFVGKRQHRV